MAEFRYFAIFFVYITLRWQYRMNLLNKAQAINLYNRRVIYIPLTLALLAFPISQGGLYCGILYKLKKLIGDCQSAFYYLNLIRSLKLQRNKQYEELAEDVREFTLT